MDTTDIRKEIRDKGKIRFSTLKKLLDALAKTDYEYHVSVNVEYGIITKSVFTEEGAKNSIENIKDYLATK